MPLLRFMTWMHIYRRKAFLFHFPMIIIVSGYALARKSFTVNTNQRECVPTSFCENTSLSSPNESVPNLRDLVVI